MSRLIQIHAHNRHDIAETNLKPALLEGTGGSEQLSQRPDSSVGNALVRLPVA